jgi:hypothetical protein
MEYAVKTLQQAILHFADYENCREFMVFLRWPDGTPKCPYCGATKLTWLAKAKVYQCYGDHPRKKFSLKVGTIFEDSPISLEKWLPAMWLLTNCKNGISSYELHRALGVTQKTAWFMLHRIRLAMDSQSFLRIGGPEGGPVEVDETFIGGKPKNMHIRKRLKIQENGQIPDKVIVMGMLERGAKKVRAKVIPSVKGTILHTEVKDTVVPESTVYTDGAKGYDRLLLSGYLHQTVSHIGNEYVRGEVHTQGIENFWALLKRGLNGTYIAVEPFHLQRYVTEQVFRYNNRATKDNPLNDADRFMLAVSQISGKRLTYAELTGKVGETERF